MKAENTMTVFRYRPTVAPEWLVVAAPDCLLAVRLDLSSDRIEPLVSLTRGGSTVQGLLDALTAGGLTNTPSFVLAFWLPGRLTDEGVGVVARGDGRAIVTTTEGEVPIEAGGFASWTERHVDAATTVTFDLGDPGASVVELELDGGSVWASRVSVSEATGPDASTGAARPAAAPATPTAPPAPPVAPPASPVAPPASAPAPPLAPASATPVSVAPVSVTPAAVDTTEDEEPLGEPRDEDAFEDDLGDDLDDDPIEGHTIARPSRAVLAARAAAHAESELAAAPPVPPRPPAPSPAASTSAPVDTLGDHDGLTVLAEDLRAARQAGHLGASAPAQTFDVQSYELELPSGVRQRLDAPVLLGRAPSVAGVPASALPHLVTLTGDDISRNHVRVAVEGGTVVVTDLHSSNGTLVVIPGRAPEKLRGGEPTPVIAGTLIDLGGGVTVRVREA